MTACEHQWEWVQPRIHTLGERRPLYISADELEPGMALTDDETYNARCTRCGKTTWAHGWNVPMKTPESAK